MKPIISQTLIKQFENPIRCHKKINAIYIEKTHVSEPSLAMLCGSYFETKTLGSTATDKDVYDLPRKKNGEQTVDHQRIDLQIDNFLSVIQKYKINLPKPQARQLVVTTEYKGYTIRGVLDFVSGIGDEPLGLFDLKLTKDRDNDFGDFCWGTPEEMDQIQAHIYTWLFIINYKDKIPTGFTPSFYYLLFDYKPAFGDKLIKVDYNQEKENSLLERIDLCIVRIEEAEEEGWSTMPSQETCKGCPLMKNNSCKDFFRTDGSNEEW